MELFIPSIAVLLIMALIVFLILPRIGAPILAILSIVLLSYALYNHIQLFYPEYRYSTWQDQLKQYASFIIVGVLILFILLYLGFIFTTQGANALPAAAVPPANAAEVVNTANTILNKTTNIVGAIGNSVGDIINKAGNMAGIRKNNGNVNNKQGLLYELANIIKTPYKPNNRAV